MGTATVLVVDDERKIRDTVRAFLERSRYAVLVAGTGAQALDVAGRLKPDLVVLDLMLPDLPGEEVARSLRAISDVPIIMLTAKAGEADRVAGLRLGADDYVVKPFSPLELVARVDAVLRRARPGGADGVLSFGGGALVIDPAGPRGPTGRRAGRADPQRVRPADRAGHDPRAGVLPVRAGGPGARL